MRFPKLKNRSKKDLDARIHDLAHGLVRFGYDYDPYGFLDACTVPGETMDESFERLEEEIVSNIRCGNFDDVYASWLGIDPSDLEDSPDILADWKRLCAELRDIENETRRK